MYLCESKTCLPAVQVVLTSYSVKQLEGTMVENAVQDDDSDAGDNKMDDRAPLSPVGKHNHCYQMAAQHLP